MTANPSRSRFFLVLLAIGIAATAFNMRAAVVAIGPLLEAIRADTGMSTTIAGLLTTLPVICFGALSGVAPRIARRIGIDLTIWLTMVGLAAGILLRLAEPVAMLFFGTAVLGASIALANVLVPAVIKRDFPGRTGMMTGLYTMCLAAGSTLAAGLVVPLRDRFDLDWRQALALLAVPALVAVIALLPRLRLNGTALATATAQRQPTPRLWRNRLAWQVSLFMGLQSFIYFGLGSWIPVLLVDSGLSEARAGLMWSICNFAGLPFSFVVPILAQKLPDQRPLVVAMVVTWAASIVGVLVAPATFTLLWMVLFGMGGGAALSLALMFIVLRAPDTAHAASLSGMAQAIGYTLAAFAPFLFGALHDLTGDWQVSVGMILLALVPTLAAGWQAGQRRLVAPLPGPLGIPGGDR